MTTVVARGVQWALRTSVMVGPMQLPIPVMGLLPIREPRALRVQASLRACNNLSNDSSKAHLKFEILCIFTVCC